MLFCLFTNFQFFHNILMVFTDALANYRINLNLDLHFLASSNRHSKNNFYHKIGTYIILRVLIQPNKLITQKILPLL